METLTFTTRAQFLEWAERTVHDKAQHYDRVPVPPQIWTYGNGDVAKTAWGKNGSATMLSNLGFMLRTATGKLKHESDARIVSDITKRGGVVITIDWGDKDA